MKTKRLFWQDPYIVDFRADIISMSPYKKEPLKYILELNQTAFYPEGGGQPWDEGSIDGINVSYVYEEEGRIYHLVEQAPSKKKNIACTINWDRRFDFMQQHLGQHILSSVFEEYYKADTVGFHLGNRYATIDIAKPSLSIQEALKVEELANEIVFNNLAVKVQWPNQSQLAKLPIRRLPQSTKNLRIVEISGVDYNPCGGTHPNFTGEVGLIKIRKWEKNRDNTRIEFACGKRALRDYQWKNQQINELATSLSIGDFETKEAVLRLIEENKNLNKQVRNSNKSIMEYEIKELSHRAQVLGDYSLITKIFEGEGIQNLRTIASSLSQQPNTIILLGSKAQDAKIVFACSKNLDINMNNLLQELIPLINGRGGGSPTIAQGGGDKVESLETLLETGRKKIIDKYL